MASVYWLVFFVIMIGIEMATLALTTIWFAGGAIAAFILSLFGAGVELQLAVFVIVSFILLLFTRPWASRYLNRNTEKTNVDSLIGRTARVTQRIDNKLGTGSAVVGGQEWTARAQEPSEIFEPDALVEIREVQGVKLIVEKMKEGN